MLILYTFEQADGSASLRGGRRIAGAQTALTELHVDGGPWFPNVSCEEDADTYSFRAGRWHGAPDLTKQGNFPDGCWIALRFDRRSDELVARCDPFLLARWYYAQLDGKLYLSNSLLFLRQKIAGAVDINWNDAHYFLRFGYLPDKQTPLRQVFSLRSGQTLRFRGGNLSIERSETIPPQRHVRAVSSADILHVLSDSVRKEVESAGRVVVPLSGGMDSRVLLALALRYLPRDAIQTLTFGHPNSLDFRIGKQVARAHGVTNFELPMDPRPLEQLATENFSVGEGVHWSVPEYPVKPYHDALPDQSLILSGYIGDLVFGSFEPDEELVSADAALSLLLGIVEAVPEAVVNRLFPNRSTRDVLIAAENFTPSSYEAYIYESYLMNRTNFGILVHRDKYCYAAPFVHSDVLRTAYALHSSERLNQRAYFAMVREHFPELWRLPLKSSFGYPAELRHARRTMFIRTWRKFMANLDATIGSGIGRILYRHPRLNYAHPREWLAHPHREYVLQCIERLIERSPLEKSELTGLRDALARGRTLDASLLKGLVTLAQWVEAYGENP